MLPFIAFVSLKCVIVGVPTYVGFIDSNDLTGVSLHVLNDDKPFDTFDKTDTNQKWDRVSFDTEGFIAYLFCFAHR